MFIHVTIDIFGHPRSARYLSDTVYANPAFHGLLQHLVSLASLRVRIIFICSPLGRPNRCVFRLARYTNIVHNQRDSAVLPNRVLDERLCNGLKTRTIADAEKIEKSIAPRIRYSCRKEKYVQYSSLIFLTFHLAFKDIDSSTSVSVPSVVQEWAMPDLVIFHKGRDRG
jgi:hypothetical protein